MTSSPPSSGLSPAVPAESPALPAGNSRQGLRSFRNLIPHLTTRADDSHAAPVRRPRRAAVSPPHSRACQALVRFLAYHRIKPHAPPLVRAPVNSFEFHPCILPRRCTQRVCFGTGLAPDAWCTSFTARTTRVSKPVRSPRLRASASVHGQASAFATGVLPEIYRFHPSSRNSDAPSCTQALQFQAHHGVEPRTFTPGLHGRLRALYAQSFRTTLAPYVLPRLLARS